MKPARSMFHAQGRGRHLLEEGSRVPMVELDGGVVIRQEYQEVRSKLSGEGW